ncbi:hypothetical protein [Rodentibacter ratti]|uniref:Uncharacterized protein n=1 Tax=Rodentibacter ratti TaxID=1906745 RepID=A0A1V3L5D4_9PAST|nr:hypothetical protein [Rodentibacter ratti]OOF85157.1 hypothetical protein BKG88_08605 [Rodentibacter ratti]
MTIKQTLLDFAKYLGEQDKAILEQIDSKLAALKDELLGGVGDDFDTLKEIADSIANIQTGESAGAELLQKITEIKQLADNLKAKIDELESTDLKAAYAKGKGQA